MNKTCKVLHPHGVFDVSFDEDNLNEGQEYIFQTGGRFKYSKGVFEYIGNSFVKVGINSDGIVINNNKAKLIKF